jgi:hypothetical protein
MSAELRPAGPGCHQARVARRDQLPLPGGEILQPGRLPAPAMVQAGSHEGAQRGGGHLDRS